MAYFLANWMEVPTISTDQMREVDRLMVEEMGIDLLQMMENAGRNLADVARRLLCGSVSGKQIVVGVGKGNNGGGGLVAARHLHNWGANVTVLTETDTFSGVPQKQWEILQHFPVEIRFGDKALEHLENLQFGLFIDALIGYGLEREPQGWSAQIIESVNKLNQIVLSLDLPSGLDGTSGKVHEPCLRATATMTLALPKTGLAQPSAAEVTGSLYLADIGVPTELYRQLGISLSSIFVQDTSIKLEKVKLKKE